MTKKNPDSIELELTPAALSPESIPTIYLAERYKKYLADGPKAPGDEGYDEGLETLKAAFIEACAPPKGEADGQD